MVPICYPRDVVTSIDFQQAMDVERGSVSCPGRWAELQTTGHRGSSIALGIVHRDVVGDR